MAEQILSQEVLSSIPKHQKLEEHIVEIVSDSGEGAQKAGQSFGAVSAKMGNGVWTVEIIPADIQPPPRSRAGASGIRIRIGTHEVTNMGDEADLVVAFNEQVLYGRISQKSYREGTLILLENKWAESDVPMIRQQYQESLEDFKKRGYQILEIPMEKECLKIVPDPRRGKNMWVLGMLCYIYVRDLKIAEKQIAHIFRHKSEKIIQTNIELLHAGYKWAEENLEFRFEVPPRKLDKPMVVMNGNEALGMGAIAAGIELCSMYPITPASSVSHYLAEVFDRAGGRVHQAEDEIAAIGFAIGASYAGKTAMTVTSGPGMALKTEFMGLAVMAEVPLVIVNVQRGGPSTGLPTKIEQGDLLEAIFGMPGDAPKIVMAPATIEECFYFMITARKLAEAFRTPVILLSDANLATGVSTYPRPEISEDWFAPPIDQSPWEEGVPPYNWDPETGLSARPIPGQKNGNYVLTGLAHDQYSKVAYEPDINQLGCNMRSRKMSTFFSTLKPPQVFGEEEGDILLVGWGSTKGAIEESVKRLNKKGKKVSSLHLRFLHPLEPRLKGIFQKFKKVMTVEINYSDELTDPMVTPESRRHAQLAWLLRSRTLVDVDCYSRVYGQPLRPREIQERVEKELEKLS
ncbi:MAG: 2-oxoacid:acceptor oxidoreductase subunit alpha [Planctomycetota bacterium]|nr:MAG: 2-oxoacid:acceptor oxidoreductase subunit alpha [Planctomycetota bacterium]